MNRNRFIRILLFVVFVVLAAGLIYFAFLETYPQLLTLLRNGDAAQIEAYLRTSSRFTGYLCTALLQAVQVFSVVLPGAPIQVAAGIVYGTWPAFFLCHLSAVGANVLVFLAVRKMGARMDKMIPLERKSSRLDFLMKSDTPAYMTFVACLIPVLPNGFIPHVAARTKIKLRNFALAMYFGSLVPVLVLCAAGNTLIQGGYVLSAVLVVVLSLFVILLSKFKDEILRVINRFRRK